MVGAQDGEGVGGQNGGGVVDRAGRGCGQGGGGGVLDRTGGGVGAQDGEGGGVGGQDGEGVGGQDRGERQDGGGGWWTTLIEPMATGSVGRWSLPRWLHNVPKTGRDSLLGQHNTASYHRILLRHEITSHHTIF